MRTMICSSISCGEAPGQATEIDAPGKTAPGLFSRCMEK
jgi:hypothetical protein